nr:unnamed protein product [Spirometra erinaceieuropaei]
MSRGGADIHRPAQSSKPSVTGRRPTYSSLHTEGEIRPVQAVRSRDQSTITLFTTIFAAYEDIQEDQLVALFLLLFVN